MTSAPVKSVVILWSALLLVVTVLGAPRLKRQNYDALLRNKSFMETQISCVLNRGSCDRIGTRIKALVPENVNIGECPSCTKSELNNVKKIIDHVKENYPEDWKEIVKLHEENVKSESDEI